jgi:hypothetical protein
VGQIAEPLAVRGIGPDDLGPLVPAADLACERSAARWGRRPAPGEIQREHVPGRLALADPDQRVGNAHLVRRECLTLHHAAPALLHLREVARERGVQRGLGKIARFTAELEADGGGGWVEVTELDRAG